MRVWWLVDISGIEKGYSSQNKIFIYSVMAWRHQGDIVYSSSSVILRCWFVYFWSGRWSAGAGVIPHKASRELIQALATFVFTAPRTVWGAFLQHMFTCKLTSATCANVGRALWKRWYLSLVWPWGAEQWWLALLCRVGNKRNVSGGQDVPFAHLFPKVFFPIDLTSSYVIFISVVICHLISLRCPMHCYQVFYNGMEFTVAILENNLRVWYIAVRRSLSVSSLWFFNAVINDNVSAGNTTFSLIGSFF